MQVARDEAGQADIDERIIAMFGEPCSIEEVRGNFWSAIGHYDMQISECQGQGRTEQWMHLRSKRAQVLEDYRPFGFGEEDAKPVNVVEGGGRSSRLKGSMK